MDRTERDCADQPLSAEPDFLAVRPSLTAADVVIMAVAVVTSAAIVVTILYCAWKVIFG
jgi:hypothetical protein